MKGVNNISVFSGYEFVYNNISSGKFGLSIAYLEGTIPQNNMLSPPVKPILRKLPNRSKVYLCGTEVEDNGVFSFKLSFMRPQGNPIKSDERDMISNWLFSNHTFKPLKIIQDDMNSVYYNCFFTNVEYLFLGDDIYGFETEVVCDAPYAWKNPQTAEIINTPTANGVYQNRTELQVYNLSSDHNLLMPKLLEIDLADNNNYVKVTNISNNNEFFELKDLVVGDKIRIDDTYCIECVTRPNTIIVDNFFGEFLKLKNGINKIQVDGAIKRIKIKYQSGRKIG